MNVWLTATLITNRIKSYRYELSIQGQCWFLRRSRHVLLLLYKNEQYNVKILGLELKSGYINITTLYWPTFSKNYFKWYADCKSCPWTASLHHTIQRWHTFSNIAISLPIPARPSVVRSRICSDNGGSYLSYLGTYLICIKLYHWY